MVDDFKQSTHESWEAGIAHHEERKVEENFSKLLSKAKNDISDLANYIDELLRLRAENVQLKDKISELQYELACIRARG